MSELRVTVQRLATTTPYSVANLDAAVLALRGEDPTWPDEKINSVLSVVTQGAAVGPYSLAHVANMIRKAMP